MFKMTTWLWDWIKKNPLTEAQILGPAIAVGAVGGAVFFATMLMLFGGSVATDSTQTGPAGTGMGVAKYKSELAKPDPDVAEYAAIAEEIAASEGVTTDSTADLSPKLVAAMRKWTGIPDLFEDPDSYQTSVAWAMIGMTRNLNENWDGHVNLSGEAGVNCFTCHRGEPVPSNIWFKIAPGLEVAEGWGAVQNYATDQTVSTSLPHDALEKLLLEDGVIGVHDLEPRVYSDPTDPEFATWQDTERTYSLMNYFANSLGQNCVFCHNSRAFYDGAQVTPQWATAYEGIDMVQELNLDYLEPLEGLLPEHRLGPRYSDAPKAACKTCHKGYSKPLMGMDMLSDWPELAAN